EKVLRSYRRVLIPEVNLGQLLMLIRSQFLIDAEGYDRVRGKPFTIAEIVTQAERILGPMASRSSASDLGERANDHD
ncbi:MAG TPA: hypothetical protein VHM48_05880, partial [Candidatus Limnocylindrales bacterium]|nr:hypothetical protein [Candidatus Limnocylindrales bacterium]